MVDAKITFYGCYPEHTFCPICRNWIDMHNECGMIPAAIICGKCGSFVRVEVV